VLPKGLVFTFDKKNRQMNTGLGMLSMLNINEFVLGYLFFVSDCDSFNSYVP
jgi:hypothetical protein